MFDEKIFKKKEKKIGGIIFGTFIVCYGIILFLNMIKNFENFGFEVAYTQLPARPGVLPIFFSLGLILGGISLVYYSLKK